MLITGKKFSKPARSRVINGDVALSDDKKTGKNLPGEAAKTTPKINNPQKIRLDHFLVQKYPEYNRNTLQKFIKSGFVKVNGEIIKKPNYKINLESASPNSADNPSKSNGTSNSQVTNQDPQPANQDSQNSELIPTEKVELSLPTNHREFPDPTPIYEDANVLVLNKPAGLLSMAKGAYCPEKTLEDYGLLVHRLDRDTSGVVILAKNPETQKLLRKQFQDRKTHKTYYAIVEGRPKLDEALIDLPINRNYKKPNTFLVEAGGKPSQTYYKVIKSNDKFSLLELKPTTGRTHQLRVHLKHLGTPILGDPVYGSGMSAPRLFLHAYSLEITIPKGDRRTFTADLPPESTNFFKKSSPEQKPNKTPPTSEKSTRTKTEQEAHKNVS